MIEEAELPTSEEAKIELVLHNIALESIDYKGRKIRASPCQLAKSKRRALERQNHPPNGYTILAEVFNAANKLI